jgi:hypothetical protein
MKKLILFFVIVLLGITGIAKAEEKTRSVEALSEKTFVVVKDRGFDTSAVELFKIENGKIKIKDAILVKEDRINQSIKIFRFNKIVEDDLTVR